MNVNGIGAAGYPAAGKAKVRQAQDGTQSFDREFMGMASQTPPSFVGKAWTKEELIQGDGIKKSAGKPVTVLLLTFLYSTAVGCPTHLKSLRPNRTWHPARG